MNIMHLKYAVEVAQEGSINRAAESLRMSQPNLSRAIRELEANLGITLFERSARGMVPTAEGGEFLEYARDILRRIDQVEAVYKAGAPKKQRFSISAPRADYISEAFARFTCALSADPAEIIYSETDALHAVESVLRGDCRLGILRYADCYDRYFKDMLDDKNLAYELIAEFTPALIMSRENPLAAREEIRLEDLRGGIEVAHAAESLPNMPQSEARRAELSEEISRRIVVSERAGRFEILSANPQTFMWASPVPERLLRRFELVKRRCAENDRFYRDVLIYRGDYRLTELDRRFITELCNSKRDCF